MIKKKLQDCITLANMDLEKYKGFIERGTSASELLLSGTLRSGIIAEIILPILKETLTKVEGHPDDVARQIFAIILALGSTRRAMFGAMSIQPQGELGHYWEYRQKAHCTVMEAYEAILTGMIKQGELDHEGLRHLNMVLGQG